MFSSVTTLRGRVWFERGTAINLAIEDDPSRIPFGYGFSSHPKVFLNRLFGVLAHEGDGGSVCHNSVVYPL
jgi:hypothetical protein